MLTKVFFVKLLKPEKCLEIHVQFEGWLYIIMLVTKHSLVWHKANSMMHKVRSEFSSNSQEKLLSLHQDEVPRIQNFMHTDIHIQISIFCLNICGRLESTTVKML